MQKILLKICIILLRIVQKIDLKKHRENWDIGIGCVHCKHRIYEMLESMEESENE